MNPRFMYTFSIHYRLYVGDAEPVSDVVFVIADDIEGSLEKVKEFLSLVIANQGGFYEITGSSQRDPVFVGVEQEIEEQELLPETGILTGELPKGGTK